MNVGRAYGFANSSQKHESSLGIETALANRRRVINEVPKSMNPLWGLKRRLTSTKATAWRNVPKSMNPLWGLKLIHHVHNRDDDEFPKA